MVFTITGTSPLDVTATIPASKADGGKLFGRLDVTLGNITLNRNHNLTLSSLDGEILTLDVATGNPLLSISAGRTLIINSAIAGSDGLEVTGGSAATGVALTGANTFTGGIDYLMPREATTIVNSLGDAAGAGNIRFGLAGNPTQTHRHHRFEFGSGGEADLVFNHRQFELLGAFENYVIRSNNANHAFVINTDLINSNTRTSAFLKFEGSGNQANTFAGILKDGPGDGTDPSVLSIQKLNAGTWILTGANTYTGNTTVSAGTLTLADTSESRFLIGDIGVNNAILGTGTVNLDGLFVFDLTSASTTVGDFWNIVDVDSLSESYGSTFGVSSTLAAFSETATGVWNISENGQEYEFSQFTGVLTVIPEPGAALLGSLGLLMLLRRRR